MADTNLEEPQQGSKPALLRIKRKRGDAAANEIVLQAGNHAPVQKRLRPDEMLLQMALGLKLEDNPTQSRPQHALRQRRFLHVRTVNAKELTGKTAEEIRALVGDWSKQQRPSATDEAGDGTPSRPHHASIKAAASTASPSGPESVKQDLRESARQASQKARYRQVISRRQADAADRQAAAGGEGDDDRTQAGNDRTQPGEGSASVFQECFHLFDIVCTDVDEHVPRKKNTQHGPGGSQQQQAAARGAAAAAGPQSAQKRESSIMMNYMPMVREYLSEDTTHPAAAAAAAGQAAASGGAPSARKLPGRARLAAQRRQQAGAGAAAQLSALLSQPSTPAAAVAAGATAAGAAAAGDADAAMSDSEAEDFVYDVYIPIDEEWQGPEGISYSENVPIIQVEDVADLDFWNAPGAQGDEDHDSEDSNAESFYANSYPDEDTEDDSSDDEGGYSCSMRHHTWQHVDPRQALFGNNGRYGDEEYDINDYNSDDGM